MAGAHPSEQACDDSPYARRCRPDPGRDCHDPPRHPEPPRRSAAPAEPEEPRPAGQAFVLDTSVLLSDPAAFHRFAEHEVVLPLVVISELEGKRHHPELGWFARQSLRMLDELRVRHGRLDRRCRPTTTGGTLRVELNHADDGVLPPGFRNDSNDARILSVALNLAAEGRDVTLVSKDMPLRVKAASVGLRGRRVPPRPGQRPDLDRHGRAGARRGADRPAVRGRGARPRRRGRAALPHRPGAALGARLGARPGLPGQDGPAGPRRPGGVRAARPLGRAADRPRPAAGRVDRHRLAGRPGRHRQVGAGALRRAGGGDGAPPAQEGHRVPPAVRGRWPGAGLPAGHRVGEDVALGPGGLRHARRGGARERAWRRSSPRACSRCCR